MHTDKQLSILSRCQPIFLSTKIQSSVFNQIKVKMSDAEYAVILEKRVKLLARSLTFMSLWQEAQ